MREIRGDTRGRINSGNPQGAGGGGRGRFGGVTGVPGACELLQHDSPLNTLPPGPAAVLGGGLYGGDQARGITQEIA